MTLPDGSPSPGKEPRKPGVRVKVLKAKGLQEHPLEGSKDIGVEAAQAQTELWDQARHAWAKHGTIEPRFHKDMLIHQAQQSGAIMECINAYCDIEGYGHTIAPSFDTEAKGAEEQVRWLLWYKRYRSAEGVGDIDPAQAIAEPTEEEVAAELERLRRETRIQQQQAERFFANCGRIAGRPVSFTSLRRALRKDLEETGECYVEVLRDKATDQIRRLSLVESVTIRKTPLDEQTQEVDVHIRVDDISVEKAKEHRAFRRYVQININDQRICYFKEFGDPRVLDKTDGLFYKDLDDLARKKRLSKDDAKARAATELIEWRLRDPLSAYGMTRWTPVSPLAAGTREADETNLDFFGNNGIPALALLVSGGAIGDGSIDRLREHVAEVKERKTTAKMLVVEAEPYNDASPPGDLKRQNGNVQLKIERLASEQLKDALFLGYIESNEGRIGAIYRVPPLLRGRSDEYTRATAREAIRVFEELVAQTERRRFDDVLNTQLLLAMGISLVKIQSKGPDTSELGELSDIIEVLVEAGAVVPTDLRPMAEKLLGRDLPPLDDAWSGYPLAMYLKGVLPLSLDGEGSPMAPEDLKKAAKVRRIRHKLHRAMRSKSDEGEGGLLWAV